MPENNKYELTSETKVVFGKTLYRIRALVSFGSVEAGDKGGWVESECNLSFYGSAWVSGNAEVSGSARVYGNAWVYGNAEVSGNAIADKTPIYACGFGFSITVCNKTISIGCEIFRLKDFICLTRDECEERFGRVSDFDLYHECLCLLIKSARPDWNEDNSNE